MGKRIVKQFFYGIFFLAVFAGFVFLVYYLFFRSAPGCFNGRQDAGEEGIDCGGVCARACLSINLLPLTIPGDVKILKLPENRLSLLAEVRNGNSGYASPDFGYEFRLYDGAGNLIDSLPGSSFIYVGEIKYLAAINFLPSNLKNIARAEIAILRTEWQTPDKFFNPQPRIEFQKAFTNISGNQVSADGILVSNNTVAVPRGTVQALFRNAAGQVVGVSETELVNLVPGDTRTFSVIHPLLKDIDAGKTQLRAYARWQ